jgi:FkbM family methyltransferase
MGRPGHALYRRIVSGRARHWVYLVRFFWHESSGLAKLARGGPARLWLSFVRVLLCFKVAFPLRSVRQAPIPVWIRDTGRVFLSHWCDLLVLGEIYSPPRDYDFSALPKAPRTIVDLGANVGFSARFLSERYPDAKLVGYEPDPEVFELAQRNVRDHAHISLQNRAVAAEAGSLELHRFAGGSWGTSSFVTKQEVTDSFIASAVTLDSIISEVGDVDLLKIDIEGAEYEVLKACRQLDRVGCIVGEFHTIPDVDADRFFTLLDGYDILENNVLDGQGTFLASRRNEG